VLECVGVCWSVMEYVGAGWSVWRGGVTLVPLTDVSMMCQ